eukprot:TRINITY_DN2847_c0_g1_i1.p1 TRINITY_DN2847_c0_g1~~TRINITY_DN2847_c0_g1_i1.p1  ORF type:complete len:1210 (+),score=225.84 TRINITY_DN2847_c0_g1_i1:532-4161(+)
MALRPPTNGNQQRSPRSPPSRQQSPSGSPRSSLQLKPIHEEFEFDSRLSKSAVLPHNDPIIYERVEQRDNIRYVPVVTQSAKKRPLSQLLQSATDLDGAPTSPSRSRSGSTPVEPTNRKLFHLMFQAEPSVPSTLTEQPDQFSIRLRESNFLESSPEYTPSKTERRKSFEPKLLERSPGVLRVAEDLQRERCKDLERQVHELRLQNDFLRDDILRVRTRIQELQNSADASAFHSSTPSKRTSEMDPEMIRDLLNTINRLHAEKEEVQTQVAVYKGLLDLDKLGEFTKTIEEKERIILELTAQLEELQHGLGSSSVIFPSSVPVTARGANSAALSSSAEISPHSETLDSLERELFSVEKPSDTEADVIQQLKEEIASLKAATKCDIDNQLVELQNLLQKKDHTLQEYERSMAQMSSQLSDLQIKEHALVEQRLLLESDLDSARLELEGLKASLAEELEERWHTLSLEADSLREVIASKEKIIHGLEQDQLPSIRSELAEARSSLQVYQQKLTSSESQLVLLKSEILQLKDRVERFETDLPQMEAAFESQLSALIAEKTTLMETISELEATLALRDQEHSLLEQRLASVQAALNKAATDQLILEKAKAEALSETAAKQEQLESLHKSVVLLEASIQQKNSQLEDVVAKTQSMLEQAKSTAGADIANFTSQIGLLSAESEILRNDIHRLEAERFQKDAELQEMADKLSQANQHIRLLQARQEEEQKKFNEAKQEYDRLSEAERLRYEESTRALQIAYQQEKNGQELRAMKLDTEIVALQSRISELTNLLELSEQKFVELAPTLERISALSYETTRLESELAASSKALADTKEALQSAEGMLAHSRSRASEMERISEEKENELVEKARLVEMLQESLSASKASLAEIESKLQQSVSDLDSLRQASNARVSELESELRQVRSHLLEVTNEKDARVAALKEELTSSALKSEEMLVSEVEKLNTELQAIREALASERSCSVGLEHKIQTLTAQISEADKTLADRIEELEATELKLTQSQRDNIQVSEERATALLAAEASELKARNLEELLASKNFELLSLVSQLRESEARSLEERNQLENLLALKTTELDALSKAKDAVAQQLDSVEIARSEDLEKFRKDHQQMSDRVRDLERSTAEKNPSPVDDATLAELTNLRQQLESARKFQSASHGVRLWKLVSLLLAVILCTLATVSSLVFASEIEDGARHHLGLYLAGFM